MTHMKKILQLTCAILFVNATLSVAQDNANVNGHLKVQGNIFLKASAENSDDGKILFHRNADGWTPAVIKQFWTGQNFQGGLHFQTNTDGLSSLTTKMTILNNGNVGIGISNPTSKLDFGNSVANTPLIISTYGGYSGIGMDASTAGIRIVGDNYSGTKLMDVGYYNGTVAHANWQSKMMVRYDGNVGIGTTNPTQKLEVNGNAIISGQLRGSDIVSNGTNSWIFHTPDDGRKNMFIAPGLGASDGSAGWDWAKAMILDDNGQVQVQSNLSISDKFSFNPTGSSFLTGGNVGIGTKNPQNNLDIASTTGSGLRLSGLQQSNANVLPQQRALGVDNNGDVVVLSSGANSGNIWTASGDNVYRSAGNVGIGTTTPKAKLDVNGDILTTITANEELHSVAERTTRYIGLKSGITADGFTGLKLNVSQSPKCGNKSSIAFQTWGCNVSNSRDVMVIDDEGGVTMGMGINPTFNPVAPLHVLGGTNSGIRLSGSSARFTITDNVTNLWNMDNAGGTLRFFREDYNANSFGPNGSVGMVISKTGNVGIGTDNPSSQLQVAGSFNLGGVLKNNGYGISVEGASAGLFFYGESDAKNRQYGLYHVRASEETILRVNSNDHAFVLNKEGNIRIGTATMPIGYKLAVGGDVIAERVVVKLQTNWPDYVFSPTYQKATLPEVEQYILKNNHLPNIPSAQEVAEKGQDIGAMNVKMMEKIEELTLYLIEQNKRMDALEKKNEMLENALKQIKR
jgi:hypothetical protein